MTRLPPNTKVADFACPDCALRIQLKSKRGRFGASFANAAYAPKLVAIRDRDLPDYALLSYDASAWCVTDLRILPGHFMTASAVTARAPLAASARRAGWVGSTVHLDALPRDAFVNVIESSADRSASRVRLDYARFGFLNESRAESAGWFTDVLREVRRLAPGRGIEFVLSELYESAADALAEQHPDNQHVRPKIRQQLQVLRDRGVLEFLGRGRYRTRM